MKCTGFCFLLSFFYLWSQPCISQNQYLRNSQVALPHTASTDCPNMGFEQGTFSGWIAGTGTVTTGTARPNYVSTGTTVVNISGNNSSVVSNDYHTLMNVMPSNAVYPYCVGYDSLACKQVGSTLVSEIPVVSPFSSDGFSVRMNGATANFRACKLKYVTTTSATNKQLSYSYALVLNNVAGHAPGDSPYFSVEVRDEATGALIAACSSQTVVNSGVPSDSLVSSSIGVGVSYSKWKNHTIDLSGLPLGTQVSVNFEVGGCPQAGHWAYAYVDAECGGVMAPKPSVNMCAGSSSAELVAPTGFVNYQWFDPANNPIAGATGNTLTVNAPTPGAIYFVSLTTPGGCAITVPDTIKTTTLHIVNVSSNSSCTGANTGVAGVTVSGSNAPKLYTWTHLASGQIVSTAQNPTGLTPGTYSVLVTSSSCGRDSATVTIGTYPVSFQTQTHVFCGNTTRIPKPGGTNYRWYNSMGPIAGPNGTNDTLYVSNATTGDSYVLSYQGPGGCRDSIKFVLTQTVSLASVYFSNSQAVCASNSGSTVLNLSTPAAGPFSYRVSDQANNAILNVAGTPSRTVAINALAAGVYTYTVEYGSCISSNTFTIHALSDFTVSASHTQFCSSDDSTMIKVDLPQPTMCATDELLCASSNTVFLFGMPYVQSSASLNPSPYAALYKYGKSQYLVQQSDLVAAGLTAGKISSLAFPVMSGSATFNYFSIKLGCTSQNDFGGTSTGAGQSFISGTEEVYYNSSQSVSGGLNTCDFYKTFNWDGQSNIVVEVCFETGTGSQNLVVNLKQVNYIGSAYRYEMSTPVCGSALLPSTANSIVNGIYTVPNMVFGYCNFPNAVANYSLSLSNNGIVHQSYNNDSLNVTPASPLAPGASLIYTVSATYPVSGCVKSQTLSVSALSGGISATAASGSVCAGTGTSLLASGANTYTWTTGANTASIAVTPTMTTTYSVTGIDINNCLSTQTVAVIVNQNCQDVWPGDANSDGVADNFDVLELGLNYTQTGPSRPTTSNAWQSYYSNNWTGTISNGKNLNHSDCNGDGMIDNDDTLAIYNNYGLTHVFKPVENTVVDPQLTIVPDQAVVSKGSWGTSSVFLGDASAPVTNINGLAFTVNFDENLIEPNSFYIEYPTSFVNAGNQNLKFSKLYFSNGLLHTATTHTITNNVSGNGKIAVLHYRIKSNLATDEVLSIGITQAKHSDAAGVLMPLTAGSATVAAIGTSVGMSELSNGNTIGVYPNPANSLVTIHSRSTLEKIELLSITGQLILSQLASGTQHQIDLTEVANCVYFIIVYGTDQKVTRKKIAVQH